MAEQSSILMYADEAACKLPAIEEPVRFRSPAFRLWRGFPSGAARSCRHRRSSATIARPEHYAEERCARL